MNLRALRHVLWLLVAVIVAAIGLFVLMREETPNPVGPLLKPVAGIGGPFSLVDQKGQPFDQTRLLGSPTAMFFGYTFCPDVCPTTLLEASTWYQKLGADAERLKVVFVTVDPERDTPAKIGEFLSSFDPRFIGLSGPRPEIDKIIKAYRVFARKVDGKDGEYTMDHTAAVYLLDAEARFVGVINFQEPTDRAMVKLNALLAKR